MPLIPCHNGPPIRCNPSGWFWQCPWNTIPASLSYCRQNFLLVELRARFIVMVILNFLLEHFDDDFTGDGLAFVDSQPAVILQKIRKLELGDGQDMRFKRAVN